MSPKLLIHWLLLTLSGTLFALNATAAQAESRAHFGVTDYPIWSPLTGFERATLTDLPLARGNDPEALLALYLLASGVRDSDDYASAQRRVKAHVNMLSEAAPRDKHRLGALLNTSMHESFFLAESESKAPSGYAADQSRLMGIFETGEFNCISSALLYIVLAREFGLEASGVLLPSHVFVELALPGGPVEVETTSLTGFNQIHDEAFYARQSEQWHEVRGLSSVTYEDYLGRQHVSPTDLAAKNMLNQHTSPDRMSKSDSARLAETSAYINPDEPMAQLKRLYFYNEEVEALTNAKDWSSLARLMQTTYSTVLGDANALARPEPLVQPLLYYQLGALRTYAELAQEEPALATLGDILDHHPALPAQKAQIESQLVHTAAILIRRLGEQNRFADALFVLPYIQAQLPAHDAWPELARWVYLKWARYFWEQDKYQEVVDVVDEWLNEPLLPPADPQAGEVLTGAITQLVNDSIANGEPETAQLWIDQCLATALPQACEPAMASLAKAQAQTQRQEAEQNPI